MCLGANGVPGAVCEGMKEVNGTSTPLTQDTRDLTQLPCFSPALQLRPRLPHLEVGAHQDEQTVWGAGP